MVIDKAKRRTMTTGHNESISTEFESSTNTTLLEEVVSYEALDGIDIITDARHGWTVVAIGEKSHQVMNCVHITKADDAVSQRHYKLKLKHSEYFDSKDVDINLYTHTHTRSKYDHKYVCEKSRLYNNQNDSWHGVKH